MALKHWSTTAASNATADPTINWAENQAPSTVNNSARAEMAAVRTWYEDVEWRDWGHTVTRTGNTTFTIAADVTAIYTTNRPIRCTDSSTLYGIVASSSYSAPNTTVTVTLDSGNLSASLTAVSLGVIPGTQSIPIQAVRNGAAAVLAAANPWTGQQYFPTATLTDGANIAWNLYTQQVAKVTLAGNRTLDNPTNMKDGGHYTLRVIQDGTGSRTLAYGNAYKWPGGVSPNLSTGANDVDILSCTSDGTSMFCNILQDFA